MGNKYGKLVTTVFSIIMLMCPHLVSAAIHEHANQIDERVESQGGRAPHGHAGSQENHRSPRHDSRHYHNGKYYNYYHNGSYYNYLYQGRYYRNCRKVPRSKVHGHWSAARMICE